MNLRPISIARGSTLFNGSARDLHGQLCRFHQTNGNGSVIEVEGVFQDPGEQERNQGKITFHFPGDQSISYIDTSHGIVQIVPLGNAQILDGKMLDGKLKLGEELKIGSDEKPATREEIGAALSRTTKGHAYGVKVYINGSIKIFSGQLCAGEPNEIAFNLNSGSKYRLPLNEITRLNIRRIAKVR